MTIDDQIRDEKLQYDINRKAAEISALSSGKIDKYEYLTGKEILPSNQQQIIEQAKYTDTKVPLLMQILINLIMLYKARNEAIKFCDDYSSIVSDVENQAIKETNQRRTGLEILAPKQLLQRLPIALAQVKAGNNSENLLNEIRQIVYSLHQSKKITKNVYNNIIKSTQ